MKQDAAICLVLEGIAGEGENDIILVHLQNWVTYFIPKCTSWSRFQVAVSEP